MAIYKKVVLIFVVPPQFESAPIKEKLNSQTFYIHSATLKKYTVFLLWSLRGLKVSNKNKKILG